MILPSSGNIRNCGISRCSEVLHFSWNQFLNDDYTLSPQSNKSCSQFVLNNICLLILTCRLICSRWRDAIEIKSSFVKCIELKLYFGPNSTFSLQVLCRFIGCESVLFFSLLGWNWPFVDQWPKRSSDSLNIIRV